MQMTKKCIQLSDELWVAMDHIRGQIPRNPWLEHTLWDVPEIRAAAIKLGLQIPDRPVGRQETPYPKRSAA